MPAGDVKSELRAFVRLTRAARSENERAEAQTEFTAALSHLIAEHGWRNIAAFIPTATEPPILGALADMLALGLEVAVPSSTPDGRLDWIRLAPGFEDTLAADSMGMPIPSDGEATSVDNADAVFVPAAAVDRDGNRLGWGKGFYDRFLVNLKPSVFVVAIVFDADVLVDIPTEAHDISVDAIVTERDIYNVQ
jgi:5-formyltetrahydrofolate cyclo-ligase